jgi:hypothetical protein
MTDRSASLEPPRESNIPGVPEGAWRCIPCDEVHYSGDICWYWDIDPVDGGADVSLDEMNQAHARDYQERERMRELRQHLLDFLEHPHRRLGVRSRAALTEATARLWDDMLSIDRAWD